jgi:hypothetical protein
MNALTAVRNGPSLPVLLIGAAAFGWSYGFLEETQGLGMMAWWLFVAVAIIVSAIAVALGNRDSESFRPSLKAMPVLVVALVSLALGDFAAYLLEIDGRSLDNYSVTMSWPANLMVTLSLSVLFGSLLGLLAALLAHMIRRSMTRDAS